jgi:hypothetical protein
VCMKVVDAEYDDIRDYIDLAEGDGEQPVVG